MKNTTEGATGNFFMTGNDGGDGSLDSVFSELDVAPFLVDKLEAGCL